MIRQVATLAWKDLRVEFRSREILYTMIFFGATVVLIFSFAFVTNGVPSSGVVPGILWAAIAFAGTMGLSRAFDRERDSDTMRGLLLSPVSRTAILLGKVLGITAFVLVVEAVLVPMVGVLFDIGGDGIALFQEMLPLLLLLLLGTFGFALVGCVFAAMLLRTQSRDVLLPVVLYPILMPLFVAGTKGTAALLIQAAGTGVLTPELDVAYFWIRFLVVYDVVFAVVGLWVFESLVIE